MRLALAQMVIKWHNIDVNLEKCLKSLKKCSTSCKEFIVFFLQVLKFNFFFLGGLGGGGFSLPLFSIILLFSHLYKLGIILNPFSFIVIV